MTCNGTVSVCGFEGGLQDNWLITQHINTVLPGGERLRRVTAQFEGTLNGCDISRGCRQSFEVYKWQTSTIDRSAAANTNNYVRVDRVSPDVSSGTMSFVNHLDIDLDDEKDGLYMAVVDLGTCISLTRVLLIYYVCPEEISELISTPEALQSQVSVTGECVEKSSTMSGSDPVLSCGARGEWQVIIPCLCNPGYELNGTQDQCSGITLYIGMDEVFQHHAHTFEKSDLNFQCTIAYTFTKGDMFSISAINDTSVQNYFCPKFQSVQRKHSQLLSVMDHVRYVQLTVRGLGLV